MRNVIIIKYKVLFEIEKRWQISTSSTLTQTLKRTFTSSRDLFNPQTPSSWMSSAHNAKQLTPFTPIQRKFASAKSKSPPFFVF